MINILRTREAVKSSVKNLQISGKTIGFVPTMGALHQGHLELVKKAKSSSDFVIVSIFVNPLQFNNLQDFEKYPVTENADLKLLQQVGADAVFIPDVKEIYANKPLLSISFGGLDERLEGAFRPGHFSGVGIVVSKLLNIVNPDFLYLGQKDLQQVAIIRQLVSELSFDVRIDVVPTQREEDGLALSSRNMRLDQAERKAATILFRILTMAESELLKGVSWFEIREKALNMIALEPLARLEYLELVTTDTVLPLTQLDLQQSISVCLAVYIGEVRLIDNLSIIS
jgi:pantoate--beta-alanine ligase